MLNFVVKNTEEWFLGTTASPEWYRYGKVIVPALVLEVRYDEFALPL